MGLVFTELSTYVVTCSGQVYAHGVVLPPFLGHDELESWDRQWSKVTDHNLVI